MRCIVCGCEKASYRCRACRSAYCSSACYKKHRMSKEEASATYAEKHQLSKVGEAEPSSETFEHLCVVILAAQQPEKDREMKRQRMEAEADVFSDLSREKAYTSSQRGRSGDVSLAVTTTTTSACAATHMSVPELNNECGASHQFSNTAAAQQSQNSAEEFLQKESTEEKNASKYLQFHQQSSAAAATAVGNGSREEVVADADTVYILQEKHLSALANDLNVRSALRSPSLQKLIRTIDSSRSRLDALDAAQYNNADFKQFCNDVMRAIARAEGR